MIFNNNKFFYYTLSLLAITSASAAATECTEGTNEVYCVSSGGCINPTTTTCSFTGTATFDATLGDVELLCRDGQTNLPTNGCSLTSGGPPTQTTIIDPVSRLSADREYYNKLNGYWTLSGEGCIDVEFTGCVAQTNANDTNGGGHCKTVTTGQIYCPESQSCIDPSTTHCLFGGEVINGPGEVELQCANGRVNLESGGNILTGSNFQNTLGGKYIENINGKIKFTSGAKGIETGCVITQTGIVGLKKNRRGLSLRGV